MIVSNIPPMPAVNPPRPIQPGSPFHESDHQWIENNMVAVIWFLSNASEIRTALIELSPRVKS